MIFHYVLPALGLLVIAFVIIIATRPADFHITRSAVMSAPAAAVFAQVNDFHNWEAWSPWAKLDPKMKTSYEGPPAGVGAIRRWEGNNKVGAGSSTITESEPNDFVKVQLDFLRPFKATNMAEFTFNPRGNQTAVTWSMRGTNNFMGKAFCMFVNMDKMLGKDFEKGLAQMKTVVESFAGRV